MTLVKHNYRNLGNAFEDLFSQLPAAWGRELNLNTPAVNIHETADAFHLEVSAPGLNKDDFKVNLDKGLLTISYEKKSEAENKDYKTHRREFTTTSFKRSFTVEDKINEEGIQAKYDNGILKLLLPKKEDVKVAPKEISIQ